MSQLKRTRNLFIGAALVALILALGVGQAVIDQSASAQQRQAPRFEVDPMWPKPLPNHWLLGSAIGVSVDAQDHVWIIHRGAATLNARTENSAGTNPKTAEECCLAAPPVLEFDQAGNLVGHWGGPGQGYDWPESNHGITVDDKGNVWIGGNGGPDAHVLKFTRDGKFLAQFGKAGARRNPAAAARPSAAPGLAQAPGQGAPAGPPAFVGNSHDTESFGRVAKIFVDPRENEVYLSDGYLNKRVAVIDATTGKMKRYWGAYGNKPDDTDLGRYNPQAPIAQQFRNPVHCAELSNDGFVYVCDRPNDRVQVFTKDGKFVKEIIVAKTTLGDGSTWDIAFSKDPQQRFIYLADGKNQKVYIIQRDTMEILTSFGDGGRQPGQFFAVHSIATDSKGNIYTTETYEGKRLQKFVFKGMGPVTNQDQGVVWPTAGAQ
jgi:DNA-binding beta-propeller fold protein YncE